MSLTIEDKQKLSQVAKAVRLLEPTKEHICFTTLTTDTRDNSYDFQIQALDGKFYGVYVVLSNMFDVSDVINEIETNLNFSLCKL